MKRYIFIIISFFALTSFAQGNLSGIVTDSKDNSELIGVTVTVKGTSRSTATDVNGRYNIKANKGETILFSYIGMASKEYKYNGETTLNIALEPSGVILDEVVTIGYGSVKKSDLTSSISTVKGEEISQISSGNAMNALQGKVNGVQITGTGGPGAAPRVIIRGVTTVNGSDPLYVVDGMPVGTNINFLNQEDIESMEVLKDASASAIYGTRGSNGVILITTKKGKVGKTQFNFNASVGFLTLSKPNVAKASEYEQVFKTRYTNDGNVPVWNGKDNITDTEGTDWWKETVNNVATMQNYTLGFQGGNEKIVYSGSVGYYRQNSHYDYGFWQKLTARFNTEYRFSDMVKFGIDMSPKWEKWDDTPNLLNDAMRMDPTTPVFLPEEQWVSNKYSNYSRSHNSQVWNPVANISRMSSSTNEYGMLMNPYINVEPIKGLTIRSQFGINAKFRMSETFKPSFFIDNLEKLEQSYVERQAQNWADWNWTNTVNYMKTFNEKHNVNVMGGYTMEHFAEYYVKGSRENTPSNVDELQEVNAGTLNQKSEGSKGYNTLISYLARAMYNYDHRYFITASVRVDGSSKFPTGNKYATFPALSAAWRISGEEFMKDITIINNLKLRAGWGRVGNQNIDSNAYLSLISNSDYVLGGDRVLGTSVSSVGNPLLKWETVEDINVGIDAAILNNRLTVTADWFQKKSKDMLLKKENLLFLGFPMWNGQMWTNIGEMKATGWELGIEWRDQAGDFKYNVGLNLSSVKNTAEKLVTDTPLLTGNWNGDYIIRNEEGGEISRFYGYIADGIFQNQTEINAHTGEHGEILQPNAVPGDIRFKDVNNDGVLNEKDEQYIGNAFPSLMVGLNLGLTYKNWDLIANFYGTIGNDIYNTTRNLYSGEGGSNVWAGTLEKAWHGEGTSNDIPRLSVNDANSNYKRVSSFFVEDGSYFRCKQLQIGYTLPKAWTNEIGLRLSLSAQNLFTITKYSGMDPERAAMGSVTESGIDWVGYPNPRTYLVGLNLTF